jgi:hypothetical protein
MPYTFTLTATIPASPEEIYEAWLNSIGHSEVTGGEATMSDEVGAEVSAWDGYISRKASPNKKAAPKKTKGKSRATRAPKARPRAKSSARKDARGKRR